MKKYPNIVITPLKPLKPMDIKVEDYGDFYRMPVKKLNIAIWGFDTLNGATRFAFLRTPHEGPFFFPQE